MGMFALEKSLVYYLAALGANTTLLEKLKGNARRLKFDEDHLDFLEDLLIDIRQANRLAEIYSNILNNLMEARGSIVNNTMNQLIKRLTIISVVLMPLNLIAGIGGMSEFTSMTGSLPFWISYPSLVAGLGMIGWITYRILKRLS
jgi:magnesium transporter